MHRQVLRVVEAKKVVTLRFWCMRILPVGLFMALTLHFGNLVYLYLTVAFIQMLKVAAAGRAMFISCCARKRWCCPQAAVSVCQRMQCAACATKGQELMRCKTVCLRRSCCASGSCLGLVPLLVGAALTL